jgi:hypothetical protein
MFQPVSFVDEDGVYKAPGVSLHEMDSSKFSHDGTDNAQPWPRCHNEMQQNHAPIQNIAMLSGLNFET